VVSYRIYLNDSSGKKTPYTDVEAEDDPTQNFNLTGLSNETTYFLWIDAIDDGEIPNNSSSQDSMLLRTRDITPPEKPTFELIFDDPSQFIPGSGYYNGTQIALRGMVPGENRTFIDVYVDGEMYVNPNPDLPRPATLEGEFFFFIQLSEGYHHVKVRSVDPSNNAGEFSEVLDIHIDTTLPRIGAEIPKNGIIEVDSDESLLLSSNCSDDTEVHTIQWYIESDEENRTLTWETLDTSFDLGNHTVTLMVWDIAGNLNSTSFRVVSLISDDVVPVATVKEPDTDTDLDHAPVFMVLFSEPLKWTLIDAWVEGNEDGMDVRIQLLDELDATNLTISYQLTRSLRGGHNYSLIIEGIIDLRGNIGETLIFPFRTIDDDRLDSDSDGIPDVFEVQQTFLSPSDPSDAMEDQDGDGLTNVQEYALGTDLESKDSDGDEMEDGWEVNYGFNPLDRSDALQDPDGDGFTNLEEFRANTDPTDINDKPEASETDEGPLLLIVILVGAVIVIVTVLVVVVIVIKKRGEQDESLASDEESGTSLASWSEKEEEMKKECPTCGASFEPGMEYCPECGTVISSSFKEPQAGLIEEPVLDESVMDEDGIDEDEDGLFTGDDIGDIPPPSDPDMEDLSVPDMEDNSDQPPSI
jgi:hypothetical protein